MIQREAVKRMFKVFPPLGIEFAKEGATVILQSMATAIEGTATTAPADAATAKNVPA